MKNEAHLVEDIVGSIGWTDVAAFAGAAIAIGWYLLTRMTTDSNREFAPPAMLLAIALCVPTVRRLGFVAWPTRVLAFSVLLIGFYAVFGLGMIMLASLN